MWMGSLVALLLSASLYIAYRYRSLDTKGKQRMLPKGGPWGFFGWHLVKPKHPSESEPKPGPKLEPQGQGDSSSSGSGSRAESESEAVSEAESSIIITEGEYDALAVAQALQDFDPDLALDGHRDRDRDRDSGASRAGETVGARRWIKDVPVVSLPNGCSSLPLELVVKLEPFDRIFLWLDDDSSGTAASEKFSRKLGIHRCHVVRPLPGQPQPKDANDALRLGRQRGANADSNADADTDADAVQYRRNVQLMVEMVLRAQAVRHDRLVSFSDLKQEVSAISISISMSLSGWFLLFCWVRVLILSIAVLLCTVPVGATIAVARKRGNV